MHRTLVHIRRLSYLVLFSLLAACGDDKLTLAVIVRTDVVPGVEFVRVDTTLLESTEPGTAESTLEQKRLMVGRSTSYGSGANVATFSNLDARELVVLVQLIDARGSVVLERRTRMTLANDFGLSVVMTRDCSGVQCPSPGGQPLYAACIAGTCVDERCQPGAPEFCPQFVCDPSSEDASACPETAECAEATCAEGICLFLARDPSTCTESEWCNPAEGCELLSEMPMPSDASLDADVDASEDASSPDMHLDASTEDSATSFDMSTFDMSSLDMDAFDMDIDMSTMPDAASVTDLGSADVGITCSSTTVNCDGTCIDTRTDPRNCGGCGMDCTVLPHVNGELVACASGICQVSSACQAPFAHCTSDALDGCETDQSLATSCGSCSTTCPSSAPLCGSDESGRYSCASGCNASAPTLCGSTCVNVDTNPTACGACGTPCPTSDHGRAVCAARSCSIVCDAGYHLCAGTCVSDYDVDSCGGRCSACSGVADGFASCDGTNCGFACNAGFHACGSVCVDSTSISSCGSSCATCPGAPAFGMATCDGFACGFVCLAGYHKCGGACVRDDSVSACGAACISCTTPPSNGTAACVAGTCTSSCNAGYHSCSGACVSDTDPTHCGASCTLCPMPSGGSATCTSGACGSACATGSHLCGGACVSNSSTASCGTTSCSACPIPANASATCDGSACGFACNTGYSLISGACDVPAPRPIWPMTAQVMTSRSPTFRWALQGVTTGARIELCYDRACTSVISTSDVVGSSFTPSTPLPARDIIYWRLRGRYGSNTGTTSSATWQLATGALSAPFSSSAGESPHDINGDGYADVVVAAPGIGAVYVYNGHAGAAPSTTPDATLIPSSPGGDFGFDTATCDVNGDGYADVLASQQGYSGSNGRVYAYYGSASGVSTSVGAIIEAPPGITGRRFGFLLECAGDMDGNGYGDVVVTTVVPESLPAVYFYAGSATGIGTTPIKSGGLSAGSGGSRAIDTGDLNGDGYSDVLARTGSFSMLTVFYGGPSWLSALPSAQGNWETVGSATFGDFDADGYSDLLTLFTYSTPSFLQNKIQRGSPTGFVNASTFNIVMSGSFDFPPRYLAMDLNGDGYDDFIYSDPQNDEGRAYTYLSTPPYFASAPTQTIYNPTFFGRFGIDIVNGGDVDGDGRADLIVGTYGGEIAYVFLGQASGVFPAVPSAAIPSPMMASISFGQSVQ